MIMNNSTKYNILPNKKAPELTVQEKRTKFKIAARRFKEKRLRDIEKYENKIKTQLKKQKILNEQLKSIHCDSNYRYWVFSYKYDEMLTQAKYYRMQSIYLEKCIDEKISKTKKSCKSQNKKY
ncbi:hypothetical protein MHBO_002226 [Bonamia ostreae]|uniref:BZIP domain-containing protein n=1 Tax=Bonamia ostreae TaxID=126728 RepID=A0ABV2ALM0_9EUKA